ncbi:MAG TPA: DUF3536 domain-containing protein [Kofleriaceae bacterium]|nr:DUF3536 domain-containing protein [Kofleriaceae bacterium]
MTGRFVCVHGHFYQPPRDNPWLESVDPQPSAAPFHDWNARILDECYRPNAHARLIDADQYITSISNNYARMSFNVGPTLMSWLETEAPATYAGILHADRSSSMRFGGHGSALAQAYNHMIMPLASDRDRRTQVLWGLRDFEHRFGRKPAGMWLPETAVDTASLEELAEHGIEFTILAPHQARRVRPIGAEGTESWQDVSGARVDPRRVYRVALPSGRRIDVFFYDGPASRAVAFEQLLADGAKFASRLLELHGEGDGLAHIATDGETYGHHHRFGEMALAFAFQHIEHHSDARLTNYPEFRALHPAAWEAEIEERTSWSCAHGVRRWSDDCGCNSGGNDGWHQRWRGPLREALDWLRDRLAEVFEDKAAPLLVDPWAARDGYIEVILDRSAASVGRFLRAQAGRDLSRDETRMSLQLLEMQRNAMLMYTSCGWFFDDVSGTEGVQVLRYAARAIELASRVDGDLEPEMLRRLERAESNVATFASGRRVWEQLVRPSRADLRDVVAHRAVMGLFQSSDSDHDVTELYSYRVETVDFHRRTAGMARLATGIARVVSAITTAERTFCFAALHLGDHNVTGGVIPDPGRAAYDQMLAHIVPAFERADLVATQRLLDQHFRDHDFSLRSPFLDQRERILALVLEAPLAEAELAYRRVYERHAPLMSYLASLDMAPPELLRRTAELVLDQRVLRALEREPPDLDELRGSCENARRRHIELDQDSLGYAWQRALERGAERLAETPADFEQLDDLASLAVLASDMHFEVSVYEVQNLCWQLSRTTLEAKRKLAKAGNADAARWISAFARLCQSVKLRVSGLT